MKIKVLHVINSLLLGGIETQLLGILRAYDRNAFEMDVLAIGQEKGYLTEEAESLGARVFHCPKSPNLYGFSRRLLKIMASEKYTIVHSHFEAWSGAVLRAAALAGVPTRIAQLHSMKPWPMDARSKIHVRLAQDVVSLWGHAWVNRYANYIIAVSQAVRDTASWLGTVPGVIWSAGVDAEVFHPAKEPPSGMNIICVGGLLKAKRVDEVLNIFKTVLDRLPEACLLVAGTGGMEQALRVQVDALGIAHAVEFLGAVRNVPELMRCSAVMLSASEMEGLPTALLEAQACGLTVVARDIPPNREALCEELRPYLFTDASQAARNVIVLLENSKRAQVAAAAGRRYIERHFDRSKQITTLQDLYTSLFHTHGERSCLNPM